MSGERFYFGDASEKTAKRLVKAGDPLTRGVTKRGGTEWIVFVDTIATLEYMNLLIESRIVVALRDLKRVHYSDEFGKRNGDLLKEISETLEQTVRDADDEVKNKVNEDKLIGKLVDSISSITTHEVGLHVLGHLRHYPSSYRVTFPESSPEKEELADLLKKVNLDAAVCFDVTKNKVTRVEVEKENKEDCIKYLCSEMKDRRVKVNVFCAGKNYPVKFERDDIKILVNGEENKEVMFHRIKDPSRLRVRRVS